MARQSDLTCDEVFFAVNDLVPSLDQDDVAKAIRVLQTLNSQSELLTELDEDTRLSLLREAGRLSRPTRDEVRKRRRDVTRSRRRERRLAEKEKRANTGIRKARERAVFSAPSKALPPPPDSPPVELNRPRNCYVCKDEFTTLHFFYDSMCPSCSEFNYRKRFQTADVSGQVVLITGARVKIGFQAALMLLRAGANVVATTRFPVDAAKRYASEKDADQWIDRLHIHGLDLRHIPSVELFTQYFRSEFPRLDAIINNAAQTVRRPAGFYKHLIKDEMTITDRSGLESKALESHVNCTGSLGGGDAQSIVPSLHGNQQQGIGLIASAALSQAPFALEDKVTDQSLFPAGTLDCDLQQVDLRTTNSWRLKLGEIDTVEMVEVQLINAIAPFVLNNRLVPLMKLHDTGCKHIVNVTAMEGKFHRFKKYARHPHTNMAKAALNMLTHTSAAGLAPFGIFTNAVDTGWVTDEDPIQLADFKKDAHDFQPQLDIVDGAARILDPLFDGINSGEHWNGKFLKDYFPIDW